MIFSRNWGNGYEFYRRERRKRRGKKTAELSVHDDLTAGIAEIRARKAETKKRTAKPRNMRKTRKDLESGAKERTVDGRKMGQGTTKQQRNQEDTNCTNR